MKTKYEMGDRISAPDISTKHYKGLITEFAKECTRVCIQPALCPKGCEDQHCVSQIE